MRVFVLLVAGLGGLAIGRPAIAQDLMIALDKTALVAPATVTVSAQSLSEDPIVSFRWTGLPNAPRCRDARCAIEIPVASCTSVDLEAVNVFGETLTATRAVCANDPDGGEPPRLEMIVRDGRASSNVFGGSDPIEIMRGWVDGVETLGDPLSLSFDTEGGCHALDVLIADRKGRIAIAQKTVCFDDDAPQLWIGGKPSAFRPVTESHERCAESAHPLGLPIMRTGGDEELGKCGAPVEAPRSIEHVFIAGTDSRDVVSYASAFFAATPATGAPVLFFAGVQSSITAIQRKELRFPVELYGGSGPYTLSGGFGSSITDVRDDRLTVVLESVNMPVGQNFLSFTLRDSRGLEADIEASLDVRPENGIDPTPGVSNDAGTACFCVRAGRSPTWAHLLVALVCVAALRRRR